jgi:hypothetical protein
MEEKEAASVLSLIAAVVQGRLDSRMTPEGELG